MKCLSCQCEVRSQAAQFWNKKILVCPSCAELADRAKARLDVMMKRAHAQAVMDLEERLLRGQLLEAPTPTWMNFEVRDER